MVHRRLVYKYLLNVPSFISRYFNKIKRKSRLGRLLALSLEILENKIMARSEKLILWIGQHTRWWFLLHRRVAKAPTSLHVCMTSQSMQAEEDSKQFLDI